MTNILPIDLTIIFSDQHLQDVAIDLGKSLQAKQILSFEETWCISSFHLIDNYWPLGLSVAQVVLQTPGHSSPLCKRSLKYLE